MIRAGGAVASLLLIPSIASGQIVIEPAPDGDAAMVAQEIILRNFEQATCPLVVTATRLGDGSIRAVCNNEEAFRVFSMPEIGPVALKCSAADELGVSGC